MISQYLCMKSNWWLCCCSVSQSCLTLCNPMNCSSQTFLSFTISWSLLKLMSIESFLLSNHLIFCLPLLLLPSIYPIIRVFSNEWALCIRWPKYWSSALVFPINKDWFPLRLTGLISLLSKELSKSLLQPQLEGINSLPLSLLYGTTLTSVHDYWKSNSFDYKDLCH